jgi:membrane-bound serine protease (ClpP class)
VNFILIPDVAFVFLGAALLVTIFALLAPGSGVLEIIALVLLFAVGYSVANLPVNAWALALLLVGIVSVLVTFRRTRQWYFIVGSITILIVGMVFVFRSENGLLGVNPLLAITGAVGIGSFVWIIGHNISKTFHQKPYSDLNGMAGMIGTATTDISNDGSVYVDGENWSATCDEPITAGSRVKVIQRNGLVLKVEIVKENKKKE